MRNYRKVQPYILPEKNINLVAHGTHHLYKYADTIFRLIGEEGMLFIILTGSSQLPGMKYKERKENKNSVASFVAEGTG